jgi:uncharacterized protein (DUF433 family)
MKSPIATDPEVLGGASLFRGTRVYVQTLFDYLSGGDSLDFFLKNYPGVTREQALTVIGLAGQALIATLPTPEQVRLNHWTRDDALILRCIPDVGTSLRSLIAMMDAIDHSIPSIQGLNETLRKLRGSGLIVSDRSKWRLAPGVPERTNSTKRRGGIQAEVDRLLRFLKTIKPTADNGPDIKPVAYQAALRSYQRMAAAAFVGNRRKPS